MTDLAGYDAVQEAEQPVSMACVFWHDRVAPIFLGAAALKGLKARSGGVACNQILAPCLLHKPCQHACAAMSGCAGLSMQQQWRPATRCLGHALDTRVLCHHAQLGYQHAGLRVF